jgi:uncharacterized protein
MRTYERSAVLIEQCVECRGIFLDRGELELLMDVETAGVPVRDPGTPGVGRGGGARERGHGRGHDEDRGRDDEGTWRRDAQGRQTASDGRRRESRLGGLFDLFGGDWPESAMSPDTISINTLAALLGLAPAMIKLTLVRSGVRLAVDDRASEDDLARVFGAPAARGFFERARDRAGRGRRATSIESSPVGRGKAPVDGTER